MSSIDEEEEDDEVEADVPDEERSFSSSQQASTFRWEAENILSLGPPAIGAIAGFFAGVYYGFGFGGVGGSILLGLLGIAGGAIAGVLASAALIIAVGLLGIALVIWLFSLLWGLGK